MPDGFGCDLWWRRLFKRKAWMAVSSTAMTGVGGSVTSYFVTLTEKSWMPRGAPWRLRRHDGWGSGRRQKSVCSGFQSYG